jgi:hypothetical protein
MAPRRRLAVAAALLPWSMRATAQPPPAAGLPALPRGNPANAAPNIPPPPLQPEPGDVWSEVRAWDEGHRKRMGLTGEPAKPAAKPAPAKPARRPQ